MPCLTGCKEDAGKEHSEGTMGLKSPIRQLSGKAPGPWDGYPERGDLQQVSPMSTSATKGWGFSPTECLQLLGLSIWLALLQNKAWPETWLPSETAVGWNSHVASSEVSIEQMRSGTSCKKPWWYLPKDVAANANSTASAVGGLQCLDARHSPVVLSRQW